MPFDAKLLPEHLRLQLLKEALRLDPELKEEDLLHGIILQLDDLPEQLSRAISREARDGVADAEGYRLAFKDLDDIPREAIAPLPDDLRSALDKLQPMDPWSASIMAQQERYPNGDPLEVHERRVDPFDGKWYSLAQLLAPWAQEGLLVKCFSQLGAAVTTATARALRLEPANRSYRSGFTINYRALFPDESRNYRVDILEASVEQNAVIWVNGDKFEFSQEAMQCAEDLQRAWSELCHLLDRWKSGDAGDKPQRTEMRTSLVTLDVAWAAFEKKYISELIVIEDQERLPTSSTPRFDGLKASPPKAPNRQTTAESANTISQRLRDMEGKYGETEALLARPEYQAEQRRLVGCISYLNSVANFRRKGRDDLSAEVLFDAVRTIQRCDLAEKRPGVQSHTAMHMKGATVPFIMAFPCFPT
eukprot:g11902.t1